MSQDNIFYQRLKEQVKLKRKSFNQVERELGYPRNSLNNYKLGVEPSGTRLLELSDYFMVPPGYLIGKTSKGNHISLDTLFHRLDAKQKYELYTICQNWARKQLLSSSPKGE